MAPKLNDTVGFCFFLANECEMEEIMTEEGLCFTFNMLRGKETYIDEYGLQIVSDKSINIFTIRKAQSTHIYGTTKRHIGI